jgi:hypothetical protein
MAVTLRTYLNNQLKLKGLTVAQAKKNAGKYKSIAAAKKAGSLYYTDKNGKVMAAVYAEDLKKPLAKKTRTSSPRPKLRPGSQSAGPGMGVMTKAEKAEVDAANKANKAAREKMSKLPPLPKGTDTKLPSQSAAFTAFFKKNKDKFKKKSGEGYNMGAALKAFNKQKKK